MTQEKLCTANSLQYQMSSIDRDIKKLQNMMKSTGCLCVAWRDEYTDGVILEDGVKDDVLKAVYDDLIRQREAVEDEFSKL